MTNPKNILRRSFYQRKPQIVAPELLGKILMRKWKDIILAGKIVETEAYLGFSDPASHTFKGKTKRNEVVFGEAGYIYVYSIHSHHCMDIVTDSKDIPGSVLIRALEPVEGIELMKMLRKKDDLYSLTSGPGKLCKALQITREQNAVDVCDLNSEIYIIEDKNTDPFEIVKSPRIGISKAKEMELRFYISNSSYLS